MDQAQITQITNGAKNLFQAVMGIYETYLDMLEKLIALTPENDTATLGRLDMEVAEIQSALEHDIAVFDKAVQTDLEDVHQLKDKLKINDIYKKLSKT